MRQIIDIITSGLQKPLNGLILRLDGSYASVRVENHRLNRFLRLRFVYEGISFLNGITERIVLDFV